MLGPLKRLFAKPAPIRTAADMHAFLGSRAAYVSQRCSIEFCRQKAGMNWPSLVREEGFQKDLAVCQWTGFAAVLFDLCEIGEGFLRAAAGRRAAALVDWLCDSAAANLAEYPVPEFKTGGWGDDLAALRLRLQAVQERAPTPPHLVALRSGEAIWQTLPIHGNLRVDDRQVVQNNVRVNIARICDDTRPLLRVQEVADDILEAGIAA